MRSLYLAPLAVLTLLPLAAPPPALDQEKDRDALLENHRQMLRAHLDGDVEWFLRDTADEVVVVRDGDISTTTRDETRTRFHDYLGRTRFLEYRDLHPPIIHISQDGTLASVIVQVSASGRQRNDQGLEEPLQFVAAWLTLFEKREGRWTRVATVSTFEP